MQGEAARRIQEPHPGRTDHRRQRQPARLLRAAAQGRRRGRRHADQGRGRDLGRARERMQGGAGERHAPIQQAPSVLRPAVPSRPRSFRCRRICRSRPRASSGTSARPCRAWTCRKRWRARQSTAWTSTSRTCTIAVLARPPAYGAKPVSFDEGGRAGPGRGEGVSTCPWDCRVADSTEAALKGQRCPQGEVGQGSPSRHGQCLDREADDGGPDQPGREGVRHRRREEGPRRCAAKKLEATYFVPFVAHATMEPMNCTAHVQTDRCDVWGPTQAQTMTRRRPSKLTRACRRTRFSSTRPCSAAAWAGRAKPGFRRRGGECSQGARQAGQGASGRARRTSDTTPFRSATCRTGSRRASTRRAA